METDAQLILPEWATNDAPENLYGFTDTNSNNAIRVRLRRVESIVPYRRRGSTVRNSSSSRPVQSTAVTTAGAITVADVQQDATVPSRRSYDERTTSRELALL